MAADAVVVAGGAPAAAVVIVNIGGIIPSAINGRFPSGYTANTEPVVFIQFDVEWCRTTKGSKINFPLLRIFFFTAFGLSERIKLCLRSIFLE